MPQYKLLYFDILGLGEPIRLALTQAGVPFEDVRLKHEEWPQHKEKMPFGQLPVLEVDGKQVTQSTAILRYIGRKYGLEADDEFDRAVGDEMATSWLDTIPKLTGAWGEQDKELKKQKFQTFIDEFAKPRLKIFDERLTKNPSGFLVGNKVTWCDFNFYNWIRMIRDYLKVSLKEYPALDKFMQTIENLPKIKEWQAKHSNTPFTIFPSPME